MAYLWTIAVGQGSHLIRRPSEWTTGNDRPTERDLQKKDPLCFEDDKNRQLPEAPALEKAYSLFRIQSHIPAFSLECVDILPSSSEPGTVAQDVQDIFCSRGTIASHPIVTVGINFWGWGGWDLNKVLQPTSALDSFCSRKARSDIPVKKATPGLAGGPRGSCCTVSTADHYSFWIIG